MHTAPPGWKSAARWLVIAVAAAVGCGTAWAQSVVFISPGKTKEPYWDASAEAMASAAASLGMRLEVLRAERNHLQAIELVRSVASRPKALRPDYVIFTNDYSTAPEAMRLLEEAGIPNFLAYSGIQDSLAKQVGKPREKYRHWLGSLETVSIDGGYLTAKSLIETARASGRATDSKGKIQLLAMAGDRSTPTSIARNEGMRRAVAEAPDVVLVQEAYGEWNRERAATLTRGLLQRYPEVRVIWAGNDEMAFGAMDVWRSLGGQPGKDAFFSGINTSPAALTARRTGELSALAGGHFMAGAFAMVMLYDHAHGRDFKTEGLTLEKPMFVLFDGALIDRFEQRISMAKTPLNFRAYSKALNPKLTTYHFEVDRLLR